MEPINGFKNQHAFLSNFYPAPITFEGLVYPTSEHLYQALKTESPSEREFVRSAGTPGESKRRGRRVTVRENWNAIKVSIMREIVREKFLQNPELEKRLLDTGDALLVECNSWGDVYWGVCRGKGENYLGLVLMNVRLELGKRMEEKSNG